MVLSSLPVLYTELLSTNSELARSQKQQQQLQHALEQQLATLGPQVEAMVARMLGSAEKVDQTLQDADARIQKATDGAYAYVIPAMMYLALVLRFGGDNWQSLAGTGLGLGLLSSESARDGHADSRAGAAWISWERNSQWHWIVDFSWVFAGDVASKERALEIMGFNMETDEFRFGGIACAIALICALAVVCVKFRRQLCRDAKKLPS